MRDPFIVLPGEGRLLDLGTFKAEVLASADQTSDAFTLLMTQQEPPGFGPPMHRHRDAAEAFFVLEGEYLMYLHEDQRLCPAGSFVYVPRGVPHTFRVASEGLGRKLNLFSPAAMVGFFEELSAVGSHRYGHAGTARDDRGEQQHGGARPCPRHVSVAARPRPSYRGRTNGASRRSVALVTAGCVLRIDGFPVEDRP